MSEKVTYGEIIEALARKSGVSKKKSEAFTKVLISEIKSELKENGKASITNFGSFKVKEVAEREGKNPQTGEPITIPAHNRVSFSPYKALRETVNAKYAHLETQLVKENESKTEKPEKSSKPAATKTADKKDGMSTRTLVLAVLIPLLVLVLSLFLLFDPMGFFGKNSSDIQTAATSEPSAQVEQEAATSTSPAPEEEAPAPNESQAEIEDDVEESTTEQTISEAEAEPQTTMSINEEMYQVERDEWYWVIAEEVYGKARFWPLLFEQNESVDDDPDQLFPSNGLQIPQLEGTSENPTKSDYRKLAEASLIVSQAYRNSGKTWKAEEYALFAKKWDRLSQ
mgnify:CR=1 FL=1